MSLLPLHPFAIIKLCKYALQNYNEAEIMSVTWFQPCLYFVKFTPNKYFGHAEKLRYN